MNTKQLIVSSLLALLGSGAMASEATEFSIPPSTLTRAEVRAELARAMANGELVVIGEAEQYPFAAARSALARNRGDDAQPLAAVSTRSRDEVRSEARAAIRANMFNPDYVGG